MGSILRGGAVWCRALHQVGGATAIARHGRQRLGKMQRVGVALGAVLLASALEAQVFGPPGVLSNTIPHSDWRDDTGPQVTTDEAGNWIAVWSSADSLRGTTGSDPDIVIARSNDDGASWSSPVPLNTNATHDSGLDYTPAVSTDGAGNWVAVWMSTDTLGGTIGNDYDIFVARSTDDGVTWSAPAALNSNAPNTGHDVSPRIATDGVGNWIAVWHSRDTLGGTIGTDADILVSRSTDNGATWSAATPLDANAAVDSGADEFAIVSTDGFGNWVVVWLSTDDLGGTVGTDYDILVARSTDNGVTWSEPSPLNNYAASDTASDIVTQISTDSSGNWIVVWESLHNLGGTIGNDWDILVARSSDGGATWSAAMPLNTDASTDSLDDFHPDVSTDAAGNWIAVWIHRTIGIDREIRVARSNDAGASWTAPSILSENARVFAGQSDDVQVTTDAAGNWIAVWPSADDLFATLGADLDILFARSTDVGETWTAAAPLHDNAVSDSADLNPEVATDGAGNWLAVWQSEDSLGNTIGTDLDILIARSIDDGASWSAPVPLNTTAAADNLLDTNPRLMSDGAGNWVAVWQAGLFNGDDDILVAHSSDHGATWSTPIALNGNAATDSGDDLVPQITTDRAGNWVVAWTSNDPLANTIGNDLDILVARSVDNGASWSAPAPLNGNAAADSGDDRSPQLATDGSGNWIAVWYSNDSLGGTIGTDNDILFARSTDDGASWSMPAPLNTNAAALWNDFGPSVATDGAGTWLTVWVSRGDGDIVLARSTDSGLSWSAPAALNPDAPIDSGTGSRPHIASAGAGKWMTVWTSIDLLGPTTSTVFDLFVSRSADDGASWSEPEILSPIAAADRTDDLNPRIATDGAGRWVAVWHSPGRLKGLASIGVSDVFFATAVGLCGNAVSCAANCSLLPLPCRAATTSVLAIRDDGEPARDTLSWKWLKGAATTLAELADPTDSADYSFCVYAGVPPVLIAEAIAPADETKWVPIGDKGYKYKDRTGFANGLRKVTMKSGTNGSARAKLVGAGSELPVFAPPLETPVVAQLVNSRTGVCLEGRYDESDIKRNQPGKFKARAR